MENLTEQQKRAVLARGNVLVMAGAGTGKTHTLVARCLNLLREENVSLDEILIVTFTEAAATEMKQRLRAALENSLNAQLLGTPKRSEGGSTLNFLSEQLALFDAAHIGTLHSFCFKLVREHFHELGLDPQISILDEGQTRLLADETLEEQFQSHYENEDEFSLAVQDLIKIYGNGRDEPIRKLILRLHHYIQTRADAENWLAQQIENFSNVEPTQWREWFAEAISNWHAEWLPILENLRAENPKAAECLEILRHNSGSATVPVAVSGVSPETFQRILAADENYPTRKKTVFRQPLEIFFDDAKFLNSLVASNESDPLAEDWNWIRGHMKTLLQLAREFSEKFSTRKRNDGFLDFHDLEQFALKLLWNFETEKPTEIANRWREKLRFVFVDEYQDINAAQDKIIQALSRDEWWGETPSSRNRFLVGDVKQSIYRFRLADPKIFRDYAKNWRGENGQTIPLTENFRSRESLLNFINSLFELLMREEIGGANYDDEAKLKFGAKLSHDSTEFRPTVIEPRAELLLRIKQSSKGENESDDDMADLLDAEKEARLLALRFWELKNSGHKIFDDKQKAFRAADWRDFAVLLRAPSGKAEIFAKEFSRAGIPLHVERGGFYDSSEISDLLSLLQLLDNPLQDVPLIAILRSPLVGCSLDELAEIRLLQKDEKFWFALNQVQSPKVFADGHQVQSSTSDKTKKFLERFSRWRKMARQVSLSQCLEEILAETHYDDWLKAQNRGAQKFANVQRFLNLAEQFDQFQRQGLFRFLKFVEAQREIEAEPEVEPVADENAVRLMSIHQSKGLEFPIVALADLAKNFNEQDLRGEIILDEQFGLCPRVKPPKVGGRYPSLSYWLAQKNQRRELRGEELRLLYVALTRARDTLILCGSISEKKWETFFENVGTVSPKEILSARNFLDWLGIWFKVQGSKFKVENLAQGELPHLRWWIVTDEELGNRGGESPLEPKLKSRLDGVSPHQVEFGDGPLEKLRGVLDWKYEFDAATKRAAKTSVTALRRLAEELDDEAEQKFSVSSFQFSGKRLARTLAPPKTKLSAADAGAATHKFLQHFDFESATDLKSLAAEAVRLEKENYLSADERSILDLESVLSFWDSEIGKKIIAQKEFVRRELPFTAKFSPKELDEMVRSSRCDDRTPQRGVPTVDEFVVVQGVADLAIVLPNEIWLVDFKTDDVRAKDLPEKIKFYSPQLKLYARALEKIYSKPIANCWLHFLSARRTEKI